MGENWWGSRQFRKLTWFSLIWSQFQFLVIIDYFWVKNIKSIMLYHVYALIQPEQEMLSNRYGTRTTQHMHDQTTSVQSSHRVYMICYSLPKHARFCESEIVTFSRWRQMLHDSEYRNFKMCTYCVSNLWGCQSLRCVWYELHALDLQKLSIIYYRKWSITKGLGIKSIADILKFGLIKAVIQLYKNDWYWDG